jgi:hypothetical protein
MRFDAIKSAYYFSIKDILREQRTLFDGNGEASSGVGKIRVLRKNYQICEKTKEWLQKLSKHGKQ